MTFSCFRYDTVVVEVASFVAFIQETWKQVMRPLEQVGNEYLLAMDISGLPGWRIHNRVQHGPMLRNLGELDSHEEGASVNLG